MRDGSEQTRKTGERPSWHWEVAPRWGSYKQVTGLSPVMTTKEAGMGMGVGVGSSDFPL